MITSKKTGKSASERRRLENMKMPARVFSGGRCLFNEEGRPIAWVVPYEQMKGIMAIMGDIVSYEPSANLVEIEGLF